MSQRTGNKKLQKLYLIIIVVLLAAAILAIQNLSSPSADTTSVQNAPQLSVLFIDVGQADSILISLSTGEAMLIDAGEAEDTDAISEELDERNIRDIDVLVATHPHADHIGGMKELVDHYDIGRVLMPDMKSDSKVYRDLLNDINKRNIPVDEAYAGYQFSLGKAVCTVVSPDASADKDMNNESVVIYLDYFDSEFLFTGDMEEWAEDALLDTHYNINADVLKVAHHGSSTGTTEAFLDAVTPEYAVISCGRDNEYGHPHKSTLAEFQEAHTKLYRTDLSGDILFLSDGKTLTVQTGN